MSKEFEKNKLEYNVPRLPWINEKPEMQVFKFVGLTIEEENIYIDLVYGLSNRHFGTTIRTAINDGFNYKIVNWVDYWEGKTPIPAYTIEYDKNLYNPITNKLRLKSLNVLQVSVFARLVNEMIKKNGVDNINNNVIFGDEDVRKIFGLDQEGVFNYTPVKKTSEIRIPELAQS